MSTVRGNSVLPAVALVQGLGYAASLAWNLVAARSVSVDAYGYLAFGLTLVLVLQVLLGLGMSQTVIRFIPGLLASADYPGVRRTARLAASLALLPTVLLSIPLLLATAVGGGVSFRGLDGGMLMLTIVAGWGAATTATWAGFLQAAGRPVLGSFTATGLVPFGLLAVFSWLALQTHVSGPSLLRFASLVYVAAGVIGIAMLTWLLPRRLAGGGRGPAIGQAAGVDLRALISFGVKSTTIGLVYLGLTNLDRFLLGVLGDMEGVGLYTFPSRLAGALALVVYLFPPIVGPLYARFLQSSQRERALAAYRDSSHLAASATAPLCLLFLTDGGAFLRALGGPAYSDGAGVLALLAIGLFAVSGTGNNGLLLQMGGRENIELRMSIFTLGVNLVLDLALIPAYGALGAAVGTAVSLVLSTVIKVVITHRSFGVWPVGGHSWLLLMGALGFVLARLGARLIGLPAWPWWPVLGLIGYALACQPWRVRRHLLSLRVES